MPSSRRCSSVSGGAFDGADVKLEAAEVERADDAPDTARNVTVIDQTIDIERQQNVLGAVDEQVARGTLIRHDLLYPISFHHRVRAMPIVSHLLVPFSSL